jgi:hypothetical protein
MYSSEARFWYTLVSMLVPVLLYFTGKNYCICYTIFTCFNPVFLARELYRSRVLYITNVIFTDGAFYTCISVYAEFVTLTEVRAWIKHFWKREDIVKNFSCTACKKKTCVPIQFQVKDMESRITLLAF